MKKRLILVLMSMIVILPFSTVFASSNAIHGIDIVVDLQDDGSAIITQIWDVERYNGTEMYIPQAYMGDMEISDLIVTDENGVVFEDLGRDWDVDGSIDEKAFKSGINATYDGLEICWGVGSFGSHTFTLQYKLSNLVKAYDDYDGFNSRFINDGLSDIVERYTVIIKKNGVDLSTENAAIWGFGNDGPIYFKEGHIQADSARELGYNDHVTILARFNKGIFTPNSIKASNFDELKDEAFIGSDYDADINDGSGGYGYYEVDDNYGQSSFRIRNIMPLLPFIIMISGFLFSGGRRLATNLSYGTKYTINSRKYASVPHGASEFIRSINSRETYNKPPVSSYIPAIYYTYSLSNSHLKEEDLIAAYILKWIHEKKLSMEQVSEIKKKFFILETIEEDTRLRIKPGVVIDDEAERDLWDMLVEAAGSDMVLQEKEFSKWTGRNTDTFAKWFNTSRKEGFRYYLDSGLVQPYDDGKRSDNYVKLEFTGTGKDAVRSVFGFKNYLMEYTIIDERAVQEVELWDDYLILATAYGIGDEVLKELKELYPNYAFTGDYDPMLDVYLIHRMSTSFAHSSYSSYTAQTQATRSSGGGGSSSFGGGGGFSGGGSGGGGR